MERKINKKTLEHLAELSRIELEREKENKILKDLERVLEYFEELKDINTEGVESMAGGVDLKNVFREDAVIGDGGRAADKLVEAFPDKEDGYLKVPEVFK